MSNEIASLLATADVEISPAERKLSQLEQRINQSAVKIEGSFKRVGGTSQLFGNVERQINGLIRQIPGIGGALSTVEGALARNVRMFDQLEQAGRRSFATIGREAQTNLQIAQREYDKYAGKVKQVEQQLAALHSGRASTKDSYRNKFLDFEMSLPSKGLGSINVSTLSSYNKASTSLEKMKLLQREFGDEAKNMQVPVERAALAFGKLERSATQALTNADSKIKGVGKTLSFLNTEAITAAQGVTLAEKALADGAGAAEAMSGAGLAATTVIGGVALAIAAVVAVAAGGTIGLFEMAKATASSADKYFDLSQQVNIGAHVLSAFDVAAAQSGTTLNTLVNSIGIFDRKLEEASQKPTKLGRVLQANNVDIHDNQKALEGLFTILAKLPPGQTQFTLATEAFGKGAKGMLGVIKQAHGDLPTMIRLLDQMGATISDKDAEAANDFNDKLEVLNKQFDVTKVKVGMALLPEFEKLFDNLSKWLTDNQKELKEWGETFASAVSKVIGLAGTIKWAFDSIGSMMPNSQKSGGFINSLMPEGSYARSAASKTWDWVTGRDDTTSWRNGLGTVNMNAVPNQTNAQVAATAQANKQQDQALADKLKKDNDDQKKAAEAVSKLMGQKNKKAGEHLTALQSLTAFANEMHFTIPKGGGFSPDHNKGSLHAKGRAVDLSVKGKSEAQIEEMMMEARSRGFHARDERIRPEGQKKWTGPHIHLSTGKDGVSVAEQLSKSELQLAQTTAEGIKRIQGKRLADEEFFFSTSKKSFADYAVGRKEVADAIYSAQLKENDAERASIEADTNIFGQAKVAALAGVTEKREAIEQQHQDDLTKIDREAEAHRLAQADAAWSAMTALIDEKTNGITALYQRMADKGQISFAAAGAQAGQAQLDALERTRTEIGTKLTGVNPKSDEGEKLLADLRLIEEKIRNQRAQNQRNAEDDHQRDLDIEHSHAAHLSEIWDSIASSQRDSVAQQIQILTNAGASKSAIMKAQLALDLEAEKAESAIRVRKLEAERTDVQEQEAEGQYKLDLLKAINAEIEEEQRRSAERQLVIQRDAKQKQQQELKAKIDAFAGDVTSVLSDAIHAGFSNGIKAGALTFFQGLAKMLEAAAFEVLQSKLADALGSLFHVKTNNNQGQNSGGNGISDLITKGIDKIFHPHKKDKAKSSNSTSSDNQNSKVTDTINAHKDATTGATRESGQYVSDSIFIAQERNKEAMDASADKIIQGLTPKQDGFWKGLLKTAANAAIGSLTNGAVNGIFPTGGSYGGATEPGDTGNRNGGNPSNGRDLHLIVRPDPGAGAGGTRDRVVGHAMGGLIKGIGTSTSDSILGLDPFNQKATAWVSANEYIVRASSVGRIGKGTLDFINEFGRLPEMRLPRHADGGLVVPNSTYIPPVSSSPSSDNQQSPTSSRRDGDIYHMEFHLPGVKDSNEFKRVMSSSQMDAMMARRLQANNRRNFS